jgi:peptide chain release factor subunit 1
VAVIDEDAIRQLAAFRSDSAPVVSCYLDVDGRRLVRTSDVESELDHLMRRARSRSNGASAADDLERIESFVRGGFDRSKTRGLAIFSCAAHDLWQVVPLPVGVRSRIVVNAAPAVGQLEAVVQELERFGMLLVDKQRARMLVFQFGELIDRSELFEELPRDYDARGHNDQGYDREQHHVEELTAQHLRHAAQVAFHVFQEHGFDRLAVGAPAELAPTLEGFLHPYLAERLGERVNVSPAASLDEIRRAALDVERFVERRKEAELVGRLRDAVGSGSKGVAGLDATLQALVERRVEVMFVSQGYVETGWRCERCDYLCHLGPTCPVDGSQMTHVDDIVEEAVDTALNQSCRVEVCVNNADLDVLGRIGALLRF